MTMEQTAYYAAKQEEMLRNMPAAPTASDIMSREYEPVEWVIPGFVRPGLTILAGSPKIGKSWLVLNMAYAMAVGGRILGHVAVEPTETLMLALEDTERRLKERLQKIGARGSTKLFLPTEWPRGNDAVKYLELWMVDHPDTKVVFIDTLQKVSGVEDGNSYGETYDAANKVKQYADRYSLAVVVVHHTRKLGARDFLHTVAGSVGLTGAADTIITMNRSRGCSEGKLSVTGRDVEEREYGIRFDQAIGTWELMEGVPKRSSYFRKDAASGEREDE